MQLHMHTCSMAMLSHLLRTRAGKHLLGVDLMQRVMHAITSMCKASEVLAMELFCGGVLGCALRVAQRLVAAQPRGDKKSFAEDMVLKDLRPMARACGEAVPQARAHCLTAPAFLGHLLAGSRSLRCPLGAQVAEVRDTMYDGVSAWTRSARLPSLLHPASQHAWRFTVCAKAALQSSCSGDAFASRCSKQGRRTLRGPATRWCR